MKTLVKTEQHAFLFLLAVLMILGCYLIHPFLNAIIMAIVLVVLFQPLHQKYLRWTRERNVLASFFSVISVIFFLLLPLAIILTLVTSQLGDILSNGDNTSLPTSFSGIMQSLQNSVAKLGYNFGKVTGIEVPRNILQRELNQFAQKLAHYSPQVIANTANFFLHFLIMLIVLFYLFCDGQKFVTSLIRITPVKDTYEHKLASEIQKTIYGIFYGSFVTGLVQAVLATIGFSLLDIKGYFVWGVLVFFMSFIPSVGTGAVIMPLIVMLLLQGKLTQAALLTAYGGVVIGGIDNLLRPYLMHRNMHPLFLFLSIFGGITLFGAIGLLLGPMLMALLAATIKIYQEDFINKTAAK